MYTTQIVNRKLRCMQPVFNSHTKKNMLKTGLSYESHELVSSTNVAAAMGSGDLEVFATPAMIALMENAAMKCVQNELEEGSTTVGTNMSVSHVRATPIGREVRAAATLTTIDGRRLVFDVRAFEGDTEIGTGTHERFIVERQKFMNRLR